MSHSVRTPVAAGQVGADAPFLYEAAELRQLEDRLGLAGESAASGAADDFLVSPLLPVIAIAAVLWLRTLTASVPYVFAERSHGAAAPGNDDG